MKVKVVMTVVATYEVSPLDYYNGSGEPMTTQQVFKFIQQAIYKRPVALLNNPHANHAVQVTRG